MRTGVWALTAIQLVVLGCTSTMPTTPTPLTPTSPPTVSPSASARPTPPAPDNTATPSPTVAATTAPTATPIAQRWRWRQIGLIGSQLLTDPPTAVGFEGGYVVAGAEGTGAVWASGDGANWESTTLPVPGDRLRGPRRGAAFIEISDSAANGATVLLVGRICRYEVEQDQVYDYCAPIAHVSSGPGAWLAAEPFEGLETDEGSRAVATWAVADGWEAQVCGARQGVWFSSDGLHWSERPDAAPFGCAWPALNSTFTRLIANSAAYGELAALRSSPDGVTWSDVHAPFVGGVDAPRVRPIAASRIKGEETWLVVVQVEALNDPSAPIPASEMWTSTDLVQWQMAELPRSNVSQAIATSIGFVVDALNGCQTAGPENLPCPEPRQAQYWSPDGVSWTAIAPHLSGSLVIVDGPAGVLLIGAQSGRVWRLVGD